MKMIYRIALICALAAACSSHAQTAPAASVPSDTAAASAVTAPAAPAASKEAVPVTTEPSEEIPAAKTVILDPFTVDATGDRGYDSQNTLSGTRLNTPARYTGAADTEVTLPLMMDLGQFSSADILDFTPNTSSYQGSGYNATSETAELFGFNYSVRGLTINTMSQDFLSYRVPGDSYNLDRFSFTRGPNSILFGVGQPGGIINSISKQAEFQDTYGALWRTDTFGSHRTSFDLNQEILKRKLAVRVDGLSEDKMTNRDPSDRDSYRIFAALTAKPLPSTTIKINYEKGKLQWLNVLPWVADNGIQGWLNAGQQTIPTNLQNGGTTYANVKATPAGSPSVAANTAQLNAAGFEDQITTPTPAIFYNSASPVPIMDMGGFVFTARPTQYNNDRIGSFLNPPIPYTTNVVGTGNMIVQHFQNAHYDLEQKIGDNLYIDLLYFRARTINENNYGSGGDDAIYRDQNPTLETWYNTVIPNPNYGRYFTWSNNVAGYLTSYLDQTRRVTASYELDFRKMFPGLLGKILGHHNFAGLREKDTTDYIQTLADMANTSPQAVPTYQLQAAALTTALNGDNRTDSITYITPGNKLTYASPDPYGMNNYPHIIFDGTPLPPVNSDGVTPAFVASSSTRSLQWIDSQMVVAQDFFWDDKIVTTFGVRKDVSDLRLMPSASDSAGYAYDAEYRNPYNSPTGELERTGNTYTQGIVVTPIKAFSLYYNQSQDFVPPSGTSVNIYGQPLPNGTGKGRDYGFKLDFFGDRVNLTFDRFSTDYYNVPSGTYRSYMLTAMSVIQTAMQQAAPTDPMWQGAFPWPLGNLSWQSLNNSTTQGYEVTLNSNVTNNWRVTANVSTHSAASTGFGTLETQWLSQANAYFAANPQYLSILTGSGPQNSNESIAQRLQDLAGDVSLAHSLNGSSITQQPRYTFNFVTAYDFTWKPLRGFGVGASDQWRQRAIIGYAYVPGSTTIYNTGVPFYGDPTNYIGTFAYYKFTAFKVHTRLQFNITDLGNDNRLHPYRDIDSGNGTPYVERYSIGPGRSFALQASIDY